jgi:hypothetical protein
MIAAKYPNFYVRSRSKPIENGYQSINGEAATVGIANSRKVGDRDFREAVRVTYA